jgi:hypothetical protein
MFKVMCQYETKLYKRKRASVNRQMPIISFESHWFTGPIAEAFTDPKLSAKDYNISIST